MNTDFKPRGLQESSELRLSRLEKARSLRQTDRLDGLLAFHADSMKMFRDSIKVGPYFVCVICNRMLHRVTVTKCKTEKYPAVIQHIFTDVKSYDNTEYICHTCHVKAMKGKFPCHDRLDGLLAFHADSMKRFRDSIKVGPYFVCVICNRMLHRVTVTKCKTEKYPTVIQHIFTDVKSYDNTEYICHTCHVKAMKGKFPCHDRLDGLLAFHADSMKMFRDSIKVGPYFVCVICNRMLYRSRTEKSFDWLKHRHYEWNTPGQDAN